MTKEDLVQTLQGTDRLQPRGWYNSAARGNMRAIQIAVEKAVDRTNKEKDLGVKMWGTRPVDEDAKADAQTHNLSEADLPLLAEDDKDRPYRD